MSLTRSAAEGPMDPPGRPARRVSMADVARRAGVSAQTVSRVSNGHPSVVGSTREQVLTAMRELGYRPNSAARALKYGQFRTIGVILFTLSSVGNSRTLEAIVDQAAEEGYAITLIPVAVPTRDGVLGAFTRLGELAVDAVIVIMEIHLLDAATVSLPAGVPVVVVDSDADDRYTVVDTDQIDGARQAVRHLLDLGHRTVWHVAGPEESFAAERRATAWRTELEKARRPVPPLSRGDWSAESGYRAGLVLAEEPDCTAVFAANDQMALGLLRAFHEKGKVVPRDISVVGFDDIPDSGSFVPPLTTVHQDFTEVGRRCVERVVRQVRSEPVEPGTTLVPTRLVLRDSTAEPSA
ncbi:DNA-binding LacI/PurR family transcriptional regulator [Saccharothrix ecbatanensis]|uniref:DNA-binding LacI/PurR family transcriptional regulator n=1 Tax=Saccharothrix ecbatanensis TaxID=1105145 RepID=A0A7W9HKF4_9PSEU|nr:LacI family DNA-binding transcriptional regulator [Saccharothrix ecbatanensis]MBB5803932.1 DNA-binding LacI/PurR family transcriptional regulator [Saccharothrix ecbatanensis]